VENNQQWCLAYCLKTTAVKKNTEGRWIPVKATYRVFLFEGSVLPVMAKGRKFLFAGSVFHVMAIGKEFISDIYGITNIHNFKLTVSKPKYLLRNLSLKF